MVKLINHLVEFLDGDESNPLVIKKTQELPQEFLDSLKAERDASTSVPAGEFHRVASIPTVVYEKWLREGYDAQKEPIAKTLAKLKAEHLDAFITTNKAI